MKDMITKNNELSFWLLSDGIVIVSQDKMVFKYVCNFMFLKLISAFVSFSSIFPPALHLVHFASAFAGVIYKA